MTTRRIFSVLLVLILAIGLIPAEVSAAPKPKPMPRCYVALGDSISIGTSVLPGQSYPILVNAQLHAPLMLNFSRDGLNSDRLIHVLRNHYVMSSIRRANLITLTIGSNDVLGIFMDIIRKATGTTDWNAIMTDPAKLAKAVTALNNPSTVTRLKKGIKTFRKNFPYIVSRITALNPKARFVITTAYSPYHGIVIPIPGTAAVFDLGALSDQMIGGLNQVFSAMAKTKKGSKIIFVDLAVPFAVTPGTLNVELTPTTVNLDPHPNAAGQQMIANLILQRIQDMLN